LRNSDLEFLELLRVAAVEFDLGDKKESRVRETDFCVFSCDFISYNLAGVIERIE
jgi:hypothetical protein